MDNEIPYCYMPAACRNDQLLFIMLHIAVGVTGWLVYHGNPLKKPLVFADPPRPFWESVISIFHDSFTESSLWSLGSLFIVSALYFILEGSVRSIISTLSDQPFRTLPMSSTFFTNDGVWISAYLSSIAVLTLVGVLAGMWNLTKTQREKFRIVVDPIQPGTDLTMSVALSSPDKRTRQMAYYDLKLMVDEKESRLLDLLKLSHPGRNPYAWTSVLDPLYKSIVDAIEDFKAIMTEIQRALNPEPEETDSTKEKSKAGGVFFSTPKCGDIHSINDLTKLRDLVSPIETRVRFRGAHETKSPARELASVPINVAKAIFDKIKESAKSKLAKYTRVVHTVNPMTTALLRKLRKSLEAYYLLVWTTQILANVSEFSIDTDADGVISTTLGGVIGLHIHFYETAEELLTTLRPFNAKISKAELKQLGQLLTEYKKALVFFYIHYSGSAGILQISHNLVKRWTRICSSEFSHETTRGIATQENKGSHSLFLEEDLG